MASRNWIGLFSRSQAPELSNDLERGYEAALLIQIRIRQLGKNYYH